jgi:hypothetical protein
VRSRAGRRFDLVTGTSLRFLSSQADRLDLPRIDAYYLRDWFPLERLFTLTGSAYIGLRGMLRSLKRNR